MLLSATQIHDGYKFLPKGTVLETFADGSIKAIHYQLPKGNIVHYEGIICPGLVNAHCHLELSHLKGKMPEHTGLIPFLQKVPIHRNEFTEEQMYAARHEAYHSLINNGVVAIGDIANIAQTLDIRALDGLHIHSFIEAIGFTPQRAKQAFDATKKVYDRFAKQPKQKKILKQSIVPHAPYSVAQELFALINHHLPNDIISIHNQESIDENEFYQAKQGKVIDLLDGFHIDHSGFEPSGKNSLPTYGEWIDNTHPIILVHNTASQKEDVAYALAQFPKISFCLCPNANLYIENKLPDVNMLLSLEANICIGTDSLASNHKLSIVEELITLHKHFNYSWEVLLQWATINGAKALQMDDVIGSFEVGKSPGIIHLKEQDAEWEIQKLY